MPQLVWDREQDRSYETGLDRGVLYLPNGSGVAWNGLTSVVEKFDKTVTATYYDGMKISDLITFGDFSATMKAVTFPDEFVEVECSEALRDGVFFQDQPPQTFCLCYRTCIGDDSAGQANAYKLHIIYNIVAIPSDRTYASMSDQPSLVEFEWTLYAVPEETPGFRPTAHLVIDSREVDPIMLSELEAKFYGDNSNDAALMTMSDLVAFMQSWFRIEIIDNGDGTWSAVINDAIATDVLTWLDSPANGTFQLTEANATFSSDETTYDLSDTKDLSDIPSITVEYNPDDSWTASSSSTALVVDHGDGSFTIYDADAVFLDSETYRLTGS